MKYLSVCSGIEAATVAWHPLGWRPWAFSEIDAFPCAVLAHHYGSNLPGEALARNGVPNLGDMTKFQEWPNGAIDLLVGGTPCQDYSIAGKRAGMAGSRGGLTLTFVEIAARYRPQWVVWENVPGVLSSNDGRDFATFLRDMGQLGYGWAYRVLDAQYVRTCGRPYAVPQRRRRVFVVFYLGDWRPPAAVFLDAESLRGDPPPRREQGQGTAPTLAARTRGGGGLGTDFDLDGGLIAAADVVGTLCADTHPGAYTGQDAYTGRLVAHTLKAEGFDASEDGTGRGIPLVPISFDSKGSQVQTDQSGAAPTLRAMGHADSHQNGGGQLAVAFQDRFRGDDGRGYDRPPPASVEASGTLETVKPWNVATRWAVRRLTPMECERLQGFPDGYTQVPNRGKPAADGPRYKALGNSMATNAMEYIGRRIELVRGLMGGVQ